MLEKLCHDNIIRLVRYGFWDLENSYILLEYAERGSLFDIVSKRGPMTETEAKIHFRGIVEGLEHMHNQGVYHCDIKLENIGLNTYSEVKIIDFGQATKDLLTSVLAGTEGYQSPEQVKKGEYCPKHSDIFTLGICLF